MHVAISDSLFHQTVAHECAYDRCIFACIGELPSGAAKKNETRAVGKECSPLASKCVALTVPPLPANDTLHYCAPLWQAMPLACTPKNASMDDPFRKCLMAASSLFIKSDDALFSDTLQLDGTVKSQLFVSGFGVAFDLDAYTKCAEKVSSACVAGLNKLCTETSLHPNIECASSGGNNTKSCDDVETAVANCIAKECKADWTMPQNFTCAEGQCMMDCTWKHSTSECPLFSDPATQKLCHSMAKEHNCGDICERNWFKDHWMWLSIGGGGALLLVIVIVVFACVARRNRKRSGFQQIQ